MPAAPTLVRTSPAYDFSMIPRIATSRSPYFMGITCTAPSTPSSGRYRTCDLNRSFYSHSSSDPRAWNGGMIRCARYFHALVLLRSYWRKWEGFCLRRCPARAQDQAGVPKQLHAVRGRLQPLEREELGSKVLGFTARSRPHMQIVCIPMTQKTARDNKQRTWFGCIDAYSLDRYRSQLGGA